jgi:hypothetical protein
MADKKETTQQFETVTALPKVIDRSSPAKMPPLDQGAVAVPPTFNKG